MTSRHKPTLPACLNELLAPSGVPASEVEVVAATIVGKGTVQTILARGALRGLVDEPGLALIKAGVLNQGELLSASFGIESAIRIERYSLSADGRFLALAPTQSSKVWWWGRCLALGMWRQPQPVAR